MRKNYQAYVFFILSVVINISFSQDSTVQSDSTKMPLILNDSGIGKLNKNTKFDLATIEQLFPNYIVRKSKGYIEDEEFPIIQIMDGRTVLMVINPGKNDDIKSVEIKNNKIKNEFGPQIGFTYAQVFDKSSSPGCDFGSEQYSEYIICQDSKSRHISYLFAGKWESAEQRLPPPKVLSLWKVKEIIWNP